ncbi:MAG: N-acetylmuramoyl-L-alanine amidase [Eubacterium sp.]|nr:N-acetylmuramoyl-L-alanine amidase [Eubacterium sp.]
MKKFKTLLIVALSVCMLGSCISACGQTISTSEETQDTDTTQTVSEAKEVTVAKSSYTYTGSAIKPAVTVTATDGSIISDDNYSVSYASNKSIGTATVTVTLSGDYDGTLTTTFKIVPKKSKIKSVTSKKKGFTVKFKKVSTKIITGYQIQYSTKKSFSSSKKKNISSSKTSKKITGLKGGKKYYIRIRTYKTVNGAKYYSAWSAVKSVKTCKYLIAIDAGHQRYANSSLEPIGPGSSTKKAKVTGGTTGVVTGLTEYNLNLQVAKKLQKVLTNRGYEVYMIRTSNNVNISNATRAKRANKKGADIFLRIHANGSSSSSTTGAQTICMTSSNPYNSYLYKKSYKLSKAVLKAYTKKTGISSEGVKTRDDLTGTNWSKVPVTLIELGYMSNPTEDRKMANSSFQKKMAKGIADGIDDYFGN